MCVLVGILLAHHLEALQAEIRQVLTILASWLFQCIRHFCVSNRGKESQLRRGEAQEIGVIAPTPHEKLPHARGEGKRNYPPDL